jgi:CheY-like chemotaxis protein
MNLCVNGRHAMPDGGVLTLSTRRRDQLVELQVTDTGVGMTPEVLEKCLDPFFTTKPVGQGTGLGLSMVYATVRAHGGHLDMTSQPGLGTTVTMTFSASTPISAPAAREEARSVAAEDLRLHVLVVDDDELVQLALRDSISALGHRLTITDSGEQAVALLRDGLRPDVVLLDLNMPGWGGVGTLSRLREDHPDLPVILSTGRLDQSALDLKAGKKAVTLLVKPYTVNELKEKLRLSVGRTE